MYRISKQKALKRVSLSAVLALGVLATGAGVAGASPHSHDKHGHAHGHGQVIGNSEHGRQSGRDHGAGHGHAFAIRGFVTAVSATSITIAGGEHAPSTFTLTTSTTVTIGPRTAALTDLKVGQRVFIQPLASDPTTAASIFIAGNGHVRGAEHESINGQITAVTPSVGGSITVTDRNGTPTTFTIDANTTVKMNDTAGTLANLAVGESVRITPSSTSPTTAGTIEVKLTNVNGQVTAVTPSVGGSITVTDRNGTPTTFTIDANTTVTLDEAAGTLANLAVGESVKVTPSSTSPTTAGTIEVELANVNGQVTGVSGNDITVATEHGGTVTVVVSATTTYAMEGSTSASLADVKSGTFIGAKGIELAGTTTLNALSVDIASTTNGD